MNKVWMVRSDGGAAIESFVEGWVGIGASIPESLKGKSQDEIRELYIKHNPDDSKGRTNGAVGMIERFVNVIKAGDGVITYDPSARQYWVGRFEGEYYEADPSEYLPHRRSVVWEHKTISRDELNISTRNRLGSTLTLFAVSPESWEEIQALLKGEKPKLDDAADDIKISIEIEKRNVIEEARERLKDRVVELNPDQMEELMAAMLRAMGFKTRISPKGPDRGVDVFASPDGLGLQEPRIKCEVKHRKTTAMGAPEIRSFIGALRGGDRGIYLSTGGFTKEAKYESERATHPVSLLDLDDLARLIETHYDAFDTEGRALLPLTRIYWPAD